MTTKHIENVYNSYASIYDRVFGKVLRGGREVAPALLELFSGARVLDVGAGTGLSLPLWCKTVEIVGIDVSQKMLDRAQKRVDAAGLKNVTLVKMDAVKMDFPDNSFDRVLAAYVISTVPDPVRVIEEMKRVCKPGGYIVFCNHFQSENPILSFFEKVLSPLFYQVGFRTDLNIRQLARATGLEIELVEKIDLFGFWIAVRCINSK